MRVSIAVISVLVVVATGWLACDKKGGDDKDSDTNTGAVDAADDAGGPDGGDGADGIDGGIQTGQIALIGIVDPSMALQAGAKVTHVIAMDTDSSASHVAEVGADGKFSLPIEKDASFVLTYIDNTKSGEEMLVSTFGSGELNSIATTDTATNIDLGAIDVGTETATATMALEALVTAMGLSADSAATWGAIDDASLRFSNPDIDGDGKVDAASNQKFPLDFHNRFNVITKDGAAIAMSDLKNAFPPDDADVDFTGSGIYPWFEDSAYSTPLDKYEWKFSTDVVVTGEACEGMTVGDTLPADTACKLIAKDSSGVGKRPGIGLAAAVTGKYTLTAGGKTFTWPNVKTSDFSGGKGFLALFIRMDVNPSDKLLGISYRWRIKQDDGTWRAATDEEIKLIVAGAKGYISLKVDGMNSGKELGVMVPSGSEGSIVFASAAFGKEGTGGSAGGSDPSVMLPESGLTEAEVKAGLDWSRVLQNPGISYDDKLGMRFFMSFNGPN